MRQDLEKNGMIWEEAEVGAAAKEEWRSCVA